MRLEGRVIDERARPVGSATVWLDGDDHVASAPDGSFAFADREPGLYRLHAHARDRCAEITLVTLHEGRAPVVLAMAPGIAMHVRVVHRGAPVAGARVRAEPREAIATTDARGQAIVRGVGARFQLFAIEADGYAPASLSMWLAPDPGGRIERTVELERGAALGGVVLASNGAPASGVKLLMFGDRWGGELTTDERGAWHVPAACADRYRIGVASAFDVVVDHDGATARTDLVVPLRAAGRISGEVRDGSGAPVERPVAIAIRVHDVDPAQRHEMRARGDASGRFELRELPPGTYDVFAHDVARASPVQQVSVVAGADVVVDLVVEPTAIAGVVVDDLGNPVAGAAVRADVPSVSGDLTDSDGRFYLGALRSGERRLTATRSEQRLGDASVTQRVVAGTRDARIVLPRQATVRGRVSLDGAPMSFFGIALANTCGGVWLQPPTGVHDDDGRFALQMTAGAQRALAFAGPGSSLHLTSEIALEPGADVDIGEINLARGRRVTGHVRDEHGVPVAGARVDIGYLWRAHQRSSDPLTSWFECDFTAISGADGSFVFDAITSAPPSNRPPPISATHHSLGYSAAQALPEGDVEIDLVLAATGTIAGIVDGGDGFTSVRARHLVHTAEVRPAHVEPSGSFAFDRLPPGEYELEIMRAPRLPVPARQRVTVIANACARVTFAIPAA